MVVYQSPCSAVVKKSLVKSIAFLVETCGTGLVDSTACRKMAAKTWDLTAGDFP